MPTFVQVVLCFLNWSTPCTVKAKFQQAQPAMMSLVLSEQKDEVAENAPPVRGTAGLKMGGDNEGPDLGH